MYLAGSAIGASEALSHSRLRPVSHRAPPSATVGSGFPLLSGSKPAHAPRPSAGS